MKYAALIAAANAVSDVEKSFLSFLAEHGKSYGTIEEYKFRFNEFQKKEEFIQKHNALEDNHKVAHNFMSDWTEEEYARLRGYKKDLWTGDRVEKLDTSAPMDDAIDWRTKGAVTPVKNQGQCGSCWSFSATGAMEGANFNKNGALVSISEQQLVDCSTKLGNQGCNGGLMDYAFKYAESTQMETEAHYPYTARDGHCNVTQKDVALVASYKDVTPKSPTELAAALQIGPVSVAVDGASLGFQLYHGGVVKHFCGDSLDHGVLLVGMGSESGVFGETDYWIIKNSWGSGWGEKGYIRVERNMDKKAAGMCGLQLQPSYPSF